MKISERLKSAPGARIVARGQDILLGGSQGSVQAARIVLEYLIELSGKKELTPSRFTVCADLNRSG